MTRYQVLKELYKKKDKFVPGDYIISKTGISKTQLSREIRLLKEEGYIIDASNSGYRLIGTPNLLLPYEIKKNLHTEYMGKNIHFILINQIT